MLNESTSHGYSAQLSYNRCQAFLLLEYLKWKKGKREISRTKTSSNWLYWSISCKWQQIFTNSWLPIEAVFSVWQKSWVKSGYNEIPHVKDLGFWGIERGIAKMATSPLAKAATAATAKAGEFPPPNSWSHGPLPSDTTTCSKKPSKYS